jgi:hypothetical protein
MSSCCLYAGRVPQLSLQHRRQTTEGYTNPDYLNEVISFKFSFEIAN